MSHIQASSFHLHYILPTHNTVWFPLNTLCSMKQSHALYLEKQTNPAAYGKVQQCIFLNRNIKSRREVEKTPVKVAPFHTNALMS